MAIQIQFKKAIKKDARGRVALVGPAGSGKSFTMLKLARELAGPDGRIAAIDTEHGSLSKYADLFDFDVIELDSYSPQNFQESLKAAEAAKYDVFCCDSLSHFWMGKDGALEFVDMASKRSRDQMGGWKDFRPHERAMVDAMIASSCHVVVTMRTKTEYVEEVNPTTGKKQRRKVGLQPVQRDGLEYEFDMVAYMDEDNTLVVDKTRCSEYTGKAITKPTEASFAPFKEWLKGAKPVAEQPAASAAPLNDSGLSKADLHALTSKAATVTLFDSLLAIVGADEYKSVFAEISEGASNWSDLKSMSQRQQAVAALRAKVAEIEALPESTEAAA